MKKGSEGNEQVAAEKQHVRGQKKGPQATSLSDDWRKEQGSVDDAFAMYRDRKLLAILHRVVSLRWLIIVPISVVIVGLSLFQSFPPWQIWLLNSIVLLLLFVMAPQLQQALTRPNALHFFRRFVWVACLGHLFLIALTGGLNSPLLPILLVVPAVAGVLWRDWRKAALSSLLATCGLLCLGGLHSLHEPVLLFFGGLEAPLFVLWSRVLVMSFLCWVTMIFGVVLSQFYEEAASRLGESKQELIAEHIRRIRTMEGLSRRMAHEIKNPLAAIKGLAQLMERKGEKDGHLHVIIGEVERLQEILERSRSFVQHAEVWQQQEFDLRAMIEDILRVFEVRLQGCQVSFLCDERGDWKITADPGGLKQVVFNLLLNAVESLEGVRVQGERKEDSQGETLPPPPRIVLRLEEREQGVALVVRDNGPGFAFQTAGLECFLEAGVSKKEEGSGLGLAISLAIVRAQGGRLALANAQMGGAEVTIWLPREGVELMPLVV